MYGLAKIAAKVNDPELERIKREEEELNEEYTALQSQLDPELRHKEDIAFGIPGLTGAAIGGLGAALTNANNAAYRNKYTKALGVAGSALGGSAIGGVTGLAAGIPISQYYRNQQDPAIRKQMADVADQLDEKEEERLKHINRIRLHS